MQAFIPKPYPKEAVTVRVESEYLQIIDTIISHDSRFSRSSLINQCVIFAIDHMDLSELKAECVLNESLEPAEQPHESEKAVAAE